MRRTGSAGAAGNEFAAILAPDVMPERRRLYLTATPRVGTGISAGGQLLVASMDDEAVFGPVLHNYPFRRGIADGWLKDYRIVIAALADSQVRHLLEGNPGLVGEGGVPVRMAAAQAALATAAARFGLRRTLAFVPRDRPGPPVRRHPARERSECCPQDGGPPAPGRGQVRPVAR